MLDRKTQAIVDLAFSAGVQSIIDWIDEQNVESARSAAKSGREYLDLPWEVKRILEREP